MKQRKINPYVNLYKNQVIDLTTNLTKQNLYSFAVSLGEVHNLLGIMITDAIKVIGAMPQSSNENIQLRGNNYIPRQNKNRYKQTEQLKRYLKKQQDQQFLKQQEPYLQQLKDQESQQYVPQKMEIENNNTQQKIFTFNKPKNGKFNSNSHLNLTQFEFKKQQPVINQNPFKTTNTPFKKQKKSQKFNFFTQFDTQKKQNIQEPYNQEEPQLYSNHSKKTIHSNNSQSAQQTQSAQNVRYNQNQKRIAQTRSFQQLTKYQNNAQEIFQQKNNQYQNQNQKQNNNYNKKKEPFFILFDSSQTQSNDKLKQDFLEPSINQFKSSQFLEVPNNKYYGKTTNIGKSTPYFPQTQVMQLDYSHKQTQVLYSPQIKNENKPVNQYKQFNKGFNLLEETCMINNPNTEIQPFQQDIDQIQSTVKKPPSMFGIRNNLMMKNKDNQNKQQNSRQNKSKPKIQQKKIYKDNKQQQNKQPQPQPIKGYIPRRDQHGRKKSDRQVLKGSECPDCHAFYSQLQKDNIGMKNMCECSSRHRSTTNFISKSQVQQFSQEFRLN